MEKADLHRDVSNKERKAIGLQNIISRNLKVLRETLLIGTVLTGMQLGITLNAQAQRGGDPIKKAEQNMKDKQQRETESMEYQKKTFHSVDQRDIYRNIIVLKHDKKNNTYLMKRVQPGNAWNTERKNITVEQFQNPDLLRTDAKVTGIAEHILYVDDDVKKINYEKAKSMIDALRLKEKEEKENAGRKSRNDNIDNQKIQKKNERMKKSQPMPEDKNQKDKNYDPFRPQLEVKSLQG